MNTELEQVMMKAFPRDSNSPRPPQASRLYAVLCATEEPMSLDRGAGAGMWSTQKLFYPVCTPFTTELGRGEKGKSGPGLEEKNTTVKERGVEKKTLGFSKAETKKRTSADQPFPQTAVRIGAAPR